MTGPDVDPIGKSGEQPHVPPALIVDFQTLLGPEAIDFYRDGVPALIGHKVRKLDDKHRFSMPSAWRKFFDELLSYSLPGFSDPKQLLPRLHLFPSRAYAYLLETLRDSPDKPEREARRRLLIDDGITHIPLYPDGRFDLGRKRGALFEREVLLVGAANRLELWRPEQYAGYRATLPILTIPPHSEPSY